MASKARTEDACNKAAEQAIRLKALQIAARGKNYGTADIVSRAAAFTKFISGE